MIPRLWSEGIHSGREREEAKKRMRANGGGREKKKNGGGGKSRRSVWVPSAEAKMRSLYIHTRIYTRVHTYMCICARAREEEAAVRGYLVRETYARVIACPRPEIIHLPERASAV